MLHLSQSRRTITDCAARLSVVTALCLAATTAFAQSSPFVGEWMMEIAGDQRGGRVQTGLLAIERADGGLVGFVENGPITLTIDGNNISMAIDSRNSLGAPLELNLEGVLSDTMMMSGAFGPPEGTNEEEVVSCRRFPGGCIHPSGTWTAMPYVEVLPESIEPDPVDLSGVWGGAAGSGLLKWSSTLTAAGQTWYDEFDVDLDLPSLRCANSGVFSKQRGAPEIFQQEHKITFVSGGDVRHIYLDGRAEPEFVPHSAMGFSSGQWEGDHLVVETTLLTAGVKGYMGEVYSENARMFERYWLNDDGTLSGVMELLDPENFVRPPLQRTRWARQGPDGIPIRVACDVDSFFRQIYVDGLMQDYINRSDRRF